MLTGGFKEQKEEEIVLNVDPQAFSQVHATHPT